MSPAMHPHRPTAGYSVPWPMWADHSKFRLNLWLLRDIAPPVMGSFWWRQRKNRVRQLVKMADNPVGAKLPNGRFAVAEIDRHDRNTRSAGGCDIGAGIAHHHRPLQRAASRPDRPPQDLGVGLLHAEGVLAADRGKAPAEAERFQQEPRQAFELVGANRKLAAARGKAIERRVETRKRLRAVGDVGAVIDDEIGEQSIYDAIGQNAALKFDPAFDHATGAAADDVARGCVI